MSRIFFIVIFSLLFLPNLNANSNTVLSQSFESLDGKILNSLQNNQKFIYKITLQNIGKDTLKSVKLSFNIPLEFKLLKVKNAQKFSCSSAKDQLICKKKSLLPNSKKILEFEMETKKLDTQTISSILFINAKTKRGNFEDSDLKTIKVGQPLGKNANKTVDISIDNDTPKVGEEIEFSIIPKTDGTLKVKHDDTLIFKKDRNCKISDHIVECDLNRNRPLLLKAKAQKRGLSICDFTTDNNNTLSIPVDIKRVFKPNIPISIKRLPSKIQASRIFEYEVDINTSDLNRSLEEPKLIFETKSDIDYRFINTKSDKFSCKKSKSFLVCKADKLKKAEDYKLNLTLKAPKESGKLEVEYGFDYMKKRALFDIDVEEVDLDSDHISKLKVDDDIETNSNVIIFGDSVMEISSEYHLDENTLQMFPKNKLFWSHKSRSSAKLKLPEDEQIISAKLYWSGKIDRLIDEEKIYKASQIRFWSGSDQNPKTLRAKIDDLFWKNSGDLFFYSASLDITNYIKKYRDGDYFVSDLMASEGFGGDGAWQVVVLTKKNHSNKKYHIKLYRGFMPLWNSNKFQSSHSFDKSFSINMDEQSRLRRIAFFSIGSDLGYKDRLRVSNQSKNLYEKNDILQNVQSVDIYTDKILAPDMGASKITFSSLGDKLFISFVLIVQESF
jgi:hypothetical protein